MSQGNFKNCNEIFISSVAAVNYFDLLKYLKPKLYRRSIIFPKGTLFYLLTGIHHPPSAKFHGKLGPTDSSLQSQFYHTLLKYLRIICGDPACVQCKSLITLRPCSTSIWNDMDYHLKLIALSTISAEDQMYQLSEKSKKDLDELFNKMCSQTKDNTKPTALIFASCYSILHV